MGPLVPSMPRQVVIPLKTAVSSMPIKRLPSEITNERSLPTAPNVVVSKPTFILITRLAFAQPRPQGFSLKKWVPHLFFKGKALGTRLAFAEVTADWIRGTIIRREKAPGALRKVRFRGVREWW